MLRKFFFLLVALLLLILPVAAQDVLVDGLVNPRGIAFDSEGNLYVVETGNGGDIMIEGAQAPVATGLTGQVTMVSPEGDRDVIIRGFASQAVGQSRGASAVLVTDESIWLALGQSPDVYPFSMALVELNREDNRVKHFVDLFSVEVELNPDGDITESNPVDLALADDGTVYVADASCNCVFSWTESDGVQVVAAWPVGESQDVPSTVDVGPEGDLYVGFLSGFPFPQGGARIERWSGGELAQTYEGLTLVSDILVTDDGTIYAVEFGVFNQGFDPGRVVRVTADGVEPVLEGLNQPYALALNADGELFVSVNSTGGENGQVIAVGM